jgi:predicted small lipoprotein YifL
MKNAPHARSGALAILFGALAGCGQRGPLTLPDSARPIEPLPPTSTSTPEPGERGSVPAGGAPPVPPGSAGTTPPAQREPGSEDDRSDERSDRDEPGRTNER